MGHWSNIKDSSTEIMRITKTGIWVNPDVDVNDAAKVVLDAVESNIKTLVQRAVADEREACAKLADDWPDYNTQGLAEAIRGRGET